MQIKDTPNKYGVVSKILHWFIGLLFIFQFLKVFDRLNNKQNIIAENLPPWHGSIGAILAFLIILRIVWMISQFKQRDEKSILVKFGHLMLYVFMFLAPFSAIALSLSKGRAIKVFGYELISKGEPITNLSWFGELHSLIALILIALVIGHFLMVIFHKIQGKEQDVLQKMI